MVSVYNDKIITLVNEKNLLDTMEVDLLCSFEFDNNKYIVYSKNEIDYDNNIIIYFGKIIVNNNKEYIKNLSEKEYEIVKKVIRDIVEEYGD